MHACLVQGAADAAVQDEGHQQLLHVCLWHVQLLRDVGYPNACVRLYELKDHLRTGMRQSGTKQLL